MKSIHRSTVRLLSVLFAWASLAATPALAACPASDPCEHVTVYRVQGWPHVPQDSLHRDTLSLQEANATDAKAFLAAVTSMGNSQSLAIRYTVTRINTAPNHYANCNLQTPQNAGCPSSLPASQLLQCTRRCIYNNATSTANGVAPHTDTGGLWYSFPAATRKTPGVNEVWAKNVFSVKPNNRDWSEDTRIIKRVSCIAEAMSATVKPDLDSLFTNESPCPSVSALTLQAEYKQ